MISIAHSPDADDIFMYYPIALGWLGNDLGFANTAADIETLNQATLAGTYDVCAISFALYPLVAERYALLRTGTSFGNGYGPKLIKRRGERLPRRFKVALSGAHTTNAMLFSIKYPDARPVFMNFLEIEGAVKSGAVDAGVLIHESILEYDAALEVEAEIWDIWVDLAGDLPLPLGGMALRRSIPLLRAIEVESALLNAVRLAVAHKNLLSTMLLERGLIRVDAAKLDTYLKLYANNDSVELSDAALNAIDKLFALGYDHGVYKRLVKSRDYLIPREYENLRLG